MLQDNLPISFSVLPLSKPNLSVEIPLKLNLEEDIRQEDKLFLDEDERSRLVAEEGFTDRIHLTEASELSGLNGWIQLSRSVNQVYLGESFSCYISAFNNTDQEVQSLEIVVEMVTSRARTLLYENRDEPIERLEPEERRDFVVHYDVKDVCEHSIRCLVSFTSNSRDRISVPSQLLKFTTKTPVLIRTKVRPLGNQSCILEACLESLKEDEPMVLEYVRFDPVDRFLCTPVSVEQNLIKEGPLKDYINAKTMKVMGVPHCSRNFLFRLDPAVHGTDRGDSGSKALGKLEIKWKTSLGGSGRLQTQQIHGHQPGAGSHEVAGKIVSISPQPIALYRPFEIVVRLENCTDEPVGPVVVTFLKSQDQKDSHAMQMVGKVQTELTTLENEVTQDLSFSLVALESGVQSITGLHVIDKIRGYVLGVIDTLQIFVAPTQQGTKTL